jgi:hypothetical protein
MQTQTEGSTTAPRGRGTRAASGTTRSRASRAAAPPAENPGADTPPAGATPPETAADTSLAGAQKGPADPPSSPPLQLPFKQRVLAAARLRFADDPDREPITEKQLTYLLDLLHEDGQNQSLVSSTYDYLERGMSSVHASAQIDKLKGTFGQPRKAA